MLRMAFSLVRSYFVSFDFDSIQPHSSFLRSGSVFLPPVEDFLVRDLYVLAAFAEQQPASEKLKQGITQILSIIDAERQPWMNGLELLEDARENKHILSTGCEGYFTNVEAQLVSFSLIPFFGWSIKEFAVKCQG